MKLSTKIGTGFAVMLLITFVLGIISIYSMNIAKKNSRQLNTVETVELKESIQLKEKTSELMFEMRAYGFTRSQNYYKLVQEVLKDFDATIKEIEEKTKNSEVLGELKKNTKEVKNKLADYRKLIEETNGIITGKMQEDRKEMESAAKSFMESADYFLKSQSKKLIIAIEEDEMEEISERREKTELITTLRDYVSEARIANFKGQLEDDGDQLKKALKYLDMIDEITTKLQTLSSAPDDLEALGEIFKTTDEYRTAMTEYFSSLDKLTELGKTRTDIGNSILAITDNMAKETLASTLNLTSTTEDNARASMNTLYIIVLAGIILGIVIAVMLTKSILKPIVRVADELGNGADQVFNASDQLSLASQELADGSSEQASSIEETSSTLDETSSMIKQNTENTKKASELTQKAKDMSIEGNEKMKIMMEAMDDIKNSSNEIAKIIKVIDDIAFQTNMLALNAAVEAARAGDAGMGFAVVAEEVRILAQRSTQAAKDTSEMIENSINKSEKGVTIASQVAEFLETIHVQSEKINEIVKEISVASQEQTQGVVQISKAVAQMEQVTQSIASNAEESAASSEELNAQAENMKQIVGDLNFFVYGNSIAVVQHKIKNKSKGNYAKSPNKKTVEVKAEDVISLEDDPLDF